MQSVIGLFSDVELDGYHELTCLSGIFFRASHEDWFERAKLIGRLDLVTSRAESLVCLTSVGRVNFAHVVVLGHTRI